jgi:hypothetical protein
LIRLRVLKQLDDAHKISLALALKPFLQRPDAAAYVCAHALLPRGAATENA